jgi:hypothetical protein
MVSFYNKRNVGVILNELYAEEACTNTDQIHQNYYSVLSFCNKLLLLLLLLFWIQMVQGRSDYRLGTFQLCNTR